MDIQWVDLGVCNVNSFRYNKDNVNVKVTYHIGLVMVDEKIFIPYEKINKIERVNKNDL